ncbi:hypothetical protein Tco_0123460 [Tanacetum coccineum]
MDIVMEETCLEPTILKLTLLPRFKGTSWKDTSKRAKFLKNKAIMEGLINDDVESNNEDKERLIIDDTTKNLPVYIVRRFEMIKYSFGDDEEYLAVKEDEYEDLTSASEDACRAYQEIFRMIDEGWMVTRAE